MARFFKKLSRFPAKQTLIFLVVLTACATLLFSKAFNQFFSADDWFHLRLVRIESFSEFTKYFSFIRTEQSASFYRPIPTQLFFHIMYMLFGLESTWWYVMVWLASVVVSALVFFLTRKLIDQPTAMVATTLYTLSQTQYTRLLFLSAFQEVTLVLFALLSCLAMLAKRTRGNRILSLLSFVAALMSKESAVIIPGLLLLIVVWRELTEKKNLPLSQVVRSSLVELAPFFVVTALYGVLRFGVFGFAATTIPDYELSFSLRSTVHTLSWYILWSLGAAEGFINYVGSGFTVLPRFYLDFPYWGKVHLLSLVAVSAVLMLCVVSWVWNRRGELVSFRRLPEHLRSNYWLYSGGAWFLIALLPVLFLPQHKYALSLGLPMIGLSLLLGQLIVQRFRTFGWLLFVSLIALNVTAVQMHNRTHYTLLRSKISRAVYHYMQSTFPDPPAGTTLHFINDMDGNPSNWGVSKQIKQALMDDEFFRVVYPEKNIQVWYADDGGDVPAGAVKIGSQQFFQ